MKRKMLRILVVLILSLVLATSASAITYEYTAPVSANAYAAGTVFTLELTPTGGIGNYQGTFTISTPFSWSDPVGNYYADWAQFMFNGGGFQAALGPVTTSGGVTGNWSVMPISPAAGDDLLGFGSSTYATPGRSGFYLSNIGSVGDNDIDFGNTLMTNGNEDYRWIFTVAMGSEPLAGTIPFQVGFYTLGGGGDGIQTSRLSQTMSSSVPEPSTMLLLGFGLVGVSRLLKKKRGC